MHCGELLACEAHYGVYLKLGRRLHIVVISKGVYHAERVMIMIHKMMHDHIARSTSSLLLQSEAEASYYHTHKLISTASFEAQTVQADALFTGKLETRFKNHPKNKTGAGILVSRLKEDGGLPTKVAPWLSSTVLSVACAAGSPDILDCICHVCAGHNAVFGFMPSKQT